MKKVEVSESALESIKAMAAKLYEENEDLRLLVLGIVDNRHFCYIPNDIDGLFAWDERADQILRIKK